MTVDLYGQCADYDKLVSICRKFEVPLIADASEALGATYRDEQAGRFGEMAAFSFNGNKIITSGGGGMLVSKRLDWLARARFLASQARDPAPHYEHSEIGFNYRMSNLLAAVGLGQLRNLDLPPRAATRPQRVLPASVCGTARHRGHAGSLVRPQ